MKSQQGGQSGQRCSAGIRRGTRARSDRKSNPGDGTANGSFSYAPAPKFIGADSFTYTLENAAGSSTAVVTISVRA